MFLPDAWFPLKPHKQQSELYRCKTQFAAVVAGRGSGKTEVSRRYVVRQLSVRKPWHNPLYFYALPTIAQAKRVAWQPLLDLIPREWITDVNKSEMVITTIFGSKLFVLGMDKPHRAEGVQWDGGVIDESSDQKPGIFDRVLLPAFSHRKAWCWRIGVPKRTGIGAAEFKAFFEKGLDPNNKDISSFTWTSATVVNAEVIERAKSMLDEMDYNEQYNASWETLGGRVYYAFSENNISEEAVYDPRKPIIVGSDFNVDPMCWVLCQRNGDNLVCFDEILKRDTNTPATLDHLWRKYSHHASGWQFIGDASGRHRKTSAATTDYLLILNDTRFDQHVKKKVGYLKKNPLLKDRYACTNALLKNAKGEIRLLINPQCKRLIEDFVNASYKQGTNEMDESDPMLGHMSDGLGYIAYRLFPIKLNRSTAAKVII